MRLLNNWKFVLLLCMTLGLAPFFPEPHLFGKIKWILGGAQGMQAIDWWDTFQHGFPFLLFLRIIVLKILGKNKKAILVKE